MYNWHKFWSRKTWNVVAEFIKTYCPSNGVTFDPFARSGVAAFEALKHGKRAIVCDILPVSTEIIRLTIKSVSLTKLQEAYKRVENKVKKQFIGNRNFNVELVKNGLAEVVIYDKRRPWKYQEELLTAQDQAKKQKLGIWSTLVK